MCHVERKPYEPPTLILDTNVFIAAYWSPASASARLIDACVRGKAIAHYSSPIRGEVDRLLRTIGLPESYVRGLDAFWQTALEVQPVPVDPIRAQDPEDQKFLEAAAGGETDFLVTNDDHLLAVGYVGRTEILTPRSALAIVARYR